jgi:hypothetical protein
MTSSRSAKRRADCSVSPTRPRKRLHRITSPSPAAIAQPFSSMQGNPALVSNDRPVIHPDMFHNGQLYVTPDVSASLSSFLAGPSSSTLPPSDRSFHSHHPGHLAAANGSPQHPTLHPPAGPSTVRTPSPLTVSLKEAWISNPLPDRLLTDLQAIECRIHLLLPTNGAIVLPSTMPPAKQRPRASAPDPDPSLWLGCYVSAFKFLFLLHMLTSH